MGDVDDTKGAAPPASIRSIVGPALAYGTLGGSLYAIRQAYTGDPLVRPAARFGFNVGIGVAMYMAFRNRLGYDDPETDLRKVVFAGHATGAMIGLLNGSIRYAAQGAIVIGLGAGALRLGNDMLWNWARRRANAADEPGVQDPKATWLPKWSPIQRTDHEHNARRRQNALLIQTMVDDLEEFEKSQSSAAAG
ncbi:NADH-ubiquinone oxidoreductase subunit B14.7 [Plasmodiophora brassicae]